MVQQVNDVKISNLPKKGYLSSKEEKRDRFYLNESHIYKQGPLSGVKATVHKLENDILTYFPKGFAGSKNSDFYEYLSLGMVPYIVGSTVMYGLYKFANNAFKLTDKAMADNVAHKMGAGILLYGLGKLFSRKLAHSLIHASTGVNLDMKYVNRVNEVPEPGQTKGLQRKQYPGVFDSVTFYRCDLLDKDSELNHDDIYWYYDKIAKKAGYRKRLNNPHQEMGPKLRELKARTTALENVSKYIAAATGVAVGVQKAMGKIDFAKVITKTNGFDFKALKGNVMALGSAFVNSCKELWNGTNATKATKHFGKGLIIATGVSTLLTWLIPTIGFKTKHNTMNSKINTNKEYEVC